MTETIGISLKDMIPLEKLERRKIYRIVVDEAKCTGCGICVNVCPYSAIALTNRKVIVDGEKCDNCNLCVSLCPVRALSLVKRENFP